MYTVLCLHVCLQARRGHPDLTTGSYKPSCGCWELNSEPLEEQAMLLTTEPSLQPDTEYLYSRRAEILSEVLILVPNIL